jgi:hypothetical protein
LVFGWSVGRRAKAKDLMHSFAYVVGMCWAVLSFLKKKDADEFVQCTLLLNY